MKDNKNFHRQLKLFYDLIQALNGTLNNSSQASYLCVTEKQFPLNNGNENIDSTHIIRNNIFRNVLTEMSLKYLLIRNFDLVVVLFTNL